MSVEVIGGGIMGVCTAYITQQLEPRAKICIRASDFVKNTTSEIAAGFWRPVFLEDPRPELLRKWGESTFDHIRDLFNTDPLKYGAGLTYGYDMAINDDPYWKDIVYGFRNVGQKEREHFGITNVRQNSVWNYGTYWLESSKYLPVLMNEFTSRGGSLKHETVDNLKQVSGANVIVNASGLGSYQLFNDHGVYPVRGQVAKIDCPGLKYFIVDEDNQLLPNHECFTAGGTHTTGDWNLKIEENDVKHILEGCARLCPVVKNAVVLSHKVGLRPGRKTIRLEKEMKNVDGNIIPVVHNYGHGGSGITLHWGCAQDAALLAKQAIHRPNSKL